MHVAVFTKLISNLDYEKYLANILEKEFHGWMDAVIKFLAR